MNCWYSEYHYVARDENGQLTAVTANQTSRNSWTTRNKPLLDLDERETVIQTGDTERLAITQDGSLYEKVQSRYHRVEKLDGAIAIHIYQ